MVRREFGYSFLLEQYKITNDIDLVGLFEYYTIASIIATDVPCGGICLVQVFDLTRVGKFTFP